MNTVVNQIDTLRMSKNLLGVEQLIGLRNDDITVFDPYSTLISTCAQLSAGTIIYPNCMVLCGAAGALSLGQNNVLYPSTVIQAGAGTIDIGDGNTFGPGGFVSTAMNSGETVKIGNNGRFNSGANVYGNSHLGDGSQILGQISVDGCILGAGGSYREPDPDKRGGVLKGTGRAKKLNLKTGDVIQAFGIFDEQAIERQVVYHPEAPA